ncbi:hypothetical protein NDU88_010801 [Pleurodeles waltl]|uniref:Secreted protein n=1 Tax=Pleurodeles waltl TaxID=8319 RepID=A0AAV7QWR6_PLEWA|nr:hypothetical protein NDU88_010801 [Pleurodeles waltl]
MASSSWAVRKLAAAVLLLVCLDSRHNGLWNYSRWTAGQVLCSTLCDWGGFGLRKLVLSFWVPAFCRQCHGAY